MSDPGKKSDLESAVDDLGRVAAGVFGRLLGPKAVGKTTLDTDTPTLSPEADQALTDVGEGVGKLLHAVGQGLKEHPTDPIAAVNAFAEKAQHGEPPPPLEGWSGLASGARSLGEGIGSVAEGVLDALAPRKPKPAADAGDAPEGEGPADEAPDATRTPEGSDAAG